jgi:hypothetical protein
LASRFGQPKRGVARMIDIYSEGQLDKHEPEPKVTQMKERLRCLEVEEKGAMQEEVLRAEVRRAIGESQEFTKGIEKARKNRLMHSSGNCRDRGEADRSYRRAGSYCLWDNSPFSGPDPCAGTIEQAI